MGNPFIHVELATDDVAKAKAFYGGLFSWKFEERTLGPGFTYTVITSGGGPSGGILPRQMAKAPTTWLPYVQVESVDGAIRKARELGARILIEKMAIPGTGYFGILYDPSGVAIGLKEVRR